MTRIAPALIALMLSGCVDPPSTPPAAEENTAAAAAAAAPSGAPVPAPPQGPLSVVADTPCQSPTSVVTATVSWSTPLPAGSLVEIHVVEPTAEAGKLWIRRGPKGQATTPAWAREGMRFQLRQTNSGELLHEATLACR